MPPATATKTEDTKISDLEKQVNELKQQFSALKQPPESIQPPKIGKDLKKQKREWYNRQPKVARFLQLTGSHDEGEKLYEKGDVIDSISNLDIMNVIPDKPKFRRLRPDEADPVLNQSAKLPEEVNQDTWKLLMEMTLEQVQNFAKGSNISIAGIENDKEKIAFLVASSG